MDANADVIMVFHRRLTSNHGSGNIFSEFSFEFGVVLPATKAYLLWDEKTMCKMSDYIHFFVMQGQLKFSYVYWFLTMLNHKHHLQLINVNY